MKYAFLSIVFVSLSSCSTLSASDFQKNGSHAEDSDAAACEMTANAYSAGMGWAIKSSEYNKQYDACMRSKGYSRN